MIPSRLLARLFFCVILLVSGSALSQNEPAGSAVPAQPTSPATASSEEPGQAPAPTPTSTGESDAGAESKDAAPKEEEEDEISWFEFYIETLAGYEYFDLMALHADPSFLSAAQSGTPPANADAQAAAASVSQASYTGQGWTLSGGLGVRFYFLGLGLNYQYSGLEVSGETQTLAGTTTASGPIDLHTLSLQLQLILPLGPVDIMLLGSFGYARLISGIDISDAFNSDGYVGKVGLAIDIYVAQWISLGAGCTVGMLGFQNGEAQAGSLSVDALGRIVFHIN